MTNRPQSGSVPPLEDRYPEIRLLPPRHQEALTCRACLGTGLRGSGDAYYTCDACKGRGLACPLCRGARWVLTQHQPPGAREAVRCEWCLTPGQEATTIIAYIREPPDLEDPGEDPDIALFNADAERS